MRKASSTRPVPAAAAARRSHAVGFCGSRSVSVLYWRWAAPYHPRRRKMSPSTRRGHGARRVELHDLGVRAHRLVRRAAVGEDVAEGLRERRREQTAVAEAPPVRQRVGPLAVLDEQLHEPHVPLRIARGHEHRLAEEWASRLSGSFSRSASSRSTLVQLDLAAEEDPRDRRGEPRVHRAAQDGPRDVLLRVGLDGQVGEQGLRPVLRRDPLLEQVEERGLVAPVGQLARRAGRLVHRHQLARLLHPREALLPEDDPLEERPAGRVAARAHRPADRRGDGEGDHRLLRRLRRLLLLLVASVGLRRDRRRLRCRGPASLDRDAVAGTAVTARARTCRGMGQPAQHRRGHLGGSAAVLAVHRGRIAHRRRGGGRGGRGGPRGGRRRLRLGERRALGVVPRGVRHGGRAAGGALTVGRRQALAAGDGLQAPRTSSRAPAPPSDRAT